jgi:hypothetical protein
MEEEYYTPSAPPLSNEEITRRLKALDGLSYHELAQTMIDADNEYRAAKMVMAEKYRDLLLIKRTAIPTRMDRDQVHNITVVLRDGTRKQMLILPQVSVKTPKEKRHELWQWLRDNDSEDIITETVNSSTLAAYVRQQMLAGEPYPDEICEISTYEVASLRKA